ncbi:hypothetical protein [Ferruginivarius sediminum]|uniref:Class I SAM-dependent methyltransferase n=1 Tax=Ferruginivarius sediminum TaxID=2661937 RepID=A0A369TBT5_9PROT|nr:hypothetical protein [Ferruginivarius sediminum]RDD60386.1 hypothetical protein DRB17_18295 [Ferruginivarius sediminum]
MQTYEELVGGEGRLIYYRAERFRAKDLFGLSHPELTVGGHRLSLHDLSMSGVAGFDDRSADWSQSVNRRLPMRLLVGNRPLHESMCEIRRLEPTPFGVKIGLKLVDSYLDIASLVSRHEEAQVRRELDSDLSAEVAAVPAEYRRVSADVIHMLHSYRGALRRLADHAPGQADVRLNGMEEVLWHCEERILPRWRELWFEANDLLWPVVEDPDVYRAVKSYTETVLTPEFLIGPIWRRGYEKPFGYPGDFKLMHQIYSHEWQGDTPYGKLVHRLGVHVGEFVANRMVMMKDAIAETVASKPRGRRAHIASLGAGPAQEVASYLDVPALPRPATFTLMDQDHRALSHAYEQTHPKVLRHGGAAQLRCLHVSFMQLLKAGSILDELPPQDLIYSVGLTDYLSDKRVTSLIQALYERLAPGGRLVIGNVKRSREASLWPLEFIADWNLIYREEADMRRLTNGLPGSEREFLSDETNCVVMAYVKKPEQG